MVGLRVNSIESVYLPIFIFFRLIHLRIFERVLARMGFFMSLCSGWYYALEVRAKRVYRYWDLRGESLHS